MESLAAGLREGENARALPESHSDDAVGIKQLMAARLSSLFFTMYSFRKAQPCLKPDTLPIDTSAQEPRRAAPLKHARPPCRGQASILSKTTKAVSVDAVAYCMRPGVLLSWKAFNAAVAGFDAEQAQVERKRRFADAPVVHALPEADVKHLVPNERRFDLSAGTLPNHACAFWTLLDEIDLDQPLNAVVLTRLEDSHYERCKILLPAVVDVSRLAREMEKRQFQRKQSAKRTKVKTSGETSVKAVHNKSKGELVEMTLATYLFKHLTLVVAYARVGSTPITPPTVSLPREVLSSDTTQYVPDPFDIVLAYHFRVFAVAQKLPTFVALEWVARKDEQD